LTVFRTRACGRASREIRLLPGLQLVPRAGPTTTSWSSARDRQRRRRGPGARRRPHVDAVEIDPAIQQIGVDQHPLKPYADPRVTRYVNDGRAFLRTTTKQYDLVIFALPDSLTLVSSTGNVRLESFLFTVEAFGSVRDHLTPDGIFVLYNYYREPWLVTKIDSMLADGLRDEADPARLRGRRGRARGRAGRSPR
jgi:hypothetical protein